MGYFESFIGVNFWTALFVLLNTLVIFFVAKRFLILPVRKIIVERQQEIDGMYDRARNAEQSAAQKQAEYEKRLEEAQLTGERLVQEAAQRGQKREEEIIRKAGEEASVMLAKATQDAQLEKKKALNDAKDEIAGIAMDIAEKVVAREIRKEDHSALVEHFINELGDKA